MFGPTIWSVKILARLFSIHNGYVSYQLYFGSAKFHKFNLTNFNRKKMRNYPLSFRLIYNNGKGVKSELTPSFLGRRHYWIIPLGFLPLTPMVLNVTVLSNHPCPSYYNILVPLFSHILCNSRMALSQTPLCIKKIFLRQFKIFLTISSTSY